MVKNVSVYLRKNGTPYLVAEKKDYNVKTSDMHNNTEAMVKLAKTMRIMERAKETVMLFILDTANHLLAVSEISTGSIDRSILSTREVCQTMLLAGGVGAVLMHNHPSGNTSPSDIDIASTKQMMDAFKLMGLHLYDHIIVGRGGGYTSLNELGYMC